jgi:hypothetical protein
MSVGVDAQFTSALGLHVPRTVVDVELDTAERPIDCEIGLRGKTPFCPACSTCKSEGHPVHDRQRHSWRHLVSFLLKAGLHCDALRMAWDGCGKTTQLPVPLAQPDSSFTATFQAVCRAVPLRQAADFLRCTDKHLRQRIEFCVGWANLLRYVRVTA